MHAPAERLLADLEAQLTQLRTDGLYKDEAPLTTPQSAHIGVGASPAGPGGQAINLCANNYLGLADSSVLIDAAKSALDRWGFGMASVRFICGTQTQHSELERAIARFVYGPGHADHAGGRDTILYSSCFDANGGLFEVLCGAQDAIISDELNHASIIDGVRLSKAARYRYRNRDMADLEAQLVAAKDARYRLIATDGVFSMDGYVAPLDEICALADAHDALVMVDDSHAVGFVGPTGAGTPEKFGVQDRVDIVTGTLGKALGGASGGYTTARAGIVEMLRQRSRPYLFSNSLAPAITAASLAVLELLGTSSGLLDRLNENTAWFRAEMTSRGFEIPSSDHAIVPVMIGDAVKAARMADLILAEGVYVRAFSYPVVPQGKARIRTQMSAGHTRDDLERAVAAFELARERVG
ncbi:glycine C-acetyltransferase [Aestuariimicrobium kwangyangense]|uniref:glycine C-acetyltransferase n=1 Tax=Aestuariimicrobium kwangyangense TaxID=396389 RepID=UPI0003B74582